MIACFKLLSAAALVLASIPPAPTYFVAYDQVEQVLCDHVRGTAFIADHHLVTVNHVSENSGCKVKGKALSVKAEEGLDFSSGPAIPKGLKINCEGFKEGETYYALGYALGLPVQRAIVLVATGNVDPSNGMELLFGYPTVIPGMSGGPVINSRAEVVGTVNMYSQFLPLSWSRQLKDTSLCR